LSRLDVIKRQMHLVQKNSNSSDGLKKAFENKETRKKQRVPR